MFKQWMILIVSITCNSEMKLFGEPRQEIVQREFYAYICLENVKRSNWPNISHYGKGICEKFWQQHVDGQSSPQDLISYHHNPVGMYE